MTVARIAFAFPGQGSQHAGMLDAVPENDAFERLLDAAEALTGLELRTIVAMGAAEELSDTRIAQPLLYLTDWAWAVTLMETGIVPSVVAGHSLGEFAALAIAGAFSVEAGLELVVERSKLMAATAGATPGGMTAVLGLDSETVSDTIGSIEGAWVANDNSPGQVVISGTQSGIDAASEALATAGARRLVPLKVAGPFHSPLMEPARSAFEEILDQTEFRSPAIPIIQNTDPAPSQDGVLIRARLTEQMTTPVRWTETMQALAQEGPVTMLEAGPGSVLCGLARGYDDITALPVENSELERIAEEVSL